MMFDQMILAIKPSKHVKSKIKAEAATWTTRKAELQVLMQNRAGATAEEKAEYQVGLAREVARNERAAQRLCWRIN